jgi:hypothetical protein
LLGPLLIIESNSGDITASNYVSHICAIKDAVHAHLNLKWRALTIAHSTVMKNVSHLEFQHSGASKGQKNKQQKTVFQQSNGNSILRVRRKVKKHPVLRGCYVVQFRRRHRLSPRVKYADVYYSQSTDRCKVCFWLNWYYEFS